jgi:hypothetical protein
MVVEELPRYIIMFFQTAVPGHAMATEACLELEEYSVTIATGSSPEAT